MRKWFIITSGVLVIFTVLALGFGYLLKSNEEAHQAYLNKQFGQSTQSRNLSEQGGSEHPQPEAVLMFVDDVADSHEQRELLINNLMCVSHTQCKVQRVTFAKGECTVAVNAVGAALLARYQGKKSDIGTCHTAGEAQTAQCVDNICTLTKS